MIILIVGVYEFNMHSRLAFLISVGHRYVHRAMGLSDGQRFDLLYVEV